MNAISFANRFVRDLDVKSLLDLGSDSRQELADAINGGLQRLHALAPAISKTTTGSIPLEAPITVTLGVTSGSVEITGSAFTSNQLYRTIRISGDGIDNQVVGTTQLLHPYGGATGTVSAVIYCDGVALPEPYDEMIGDPRILETDTFLTHFASDWGRCKQVARPQFYRIEANAINQNSPAPSVIRFDSLPDRAYRLESKFTLAPFRIKFTDLLSPGADIPLRAEQIESYLLPISRAILTDSSLWLDKESKAAVRAAAEEAERKYATLIPQNFATPNNRVRTIRGF